MHNQKVTNPCYRIFQFNLKQNNFTSSTGINLLGDHAIIVGIIRGYDGLEWNSTDSMLNYNSIEENISANLSLLAKEQFIYERNKVVEFRRGLVNNKKIRKRL